MPIISVSKGLEVGSGSMMSEMIAGVFGRKHPTAFLSGSFPCPFSIRVSSSLIGSYDWLLCKALLPAMEDMDLLSAVIFGSIIKYS